MNKKEKLIVEIVGLVLALILFVRPAVAKLMERVQTKRQLEKKYSQMQAKLDILSGIDTTLNDNRVRQMEAVFPSTKPVVALMGSLSQLALEHNLSFGGITLSPGSLTQEAVKSGTKKVSPQGLFDLRFGFQIGGDFDKISQFLAALENTSPLMKIEGVGLSIKTNPLFEREQTVVVADIEISAYYQAPPKSLGDVTSPVKLLSRNEEALLNQLVGFRQFRAVIPQTTAGKENLFE
jgi:Tfp pilus assembly protein PilO